MMVVRDRRALPAQTFRSLQTTGRRRQESLVGWRCRGAPVKEGMHKETDRRVSMIEKFVVRIQSSCPASTAFSDLEIRLTLFYPIK